MIYSSNTPQTQVLTIGGLTLSLEQCDFDADGNQGFIGFSQVKTDEFNQDLTASIYGGYSIASNYGSQLYTFSWSLLLSTAKLMILRAMIEEQHERLAIQDPTPLVRLINQRTVHIERSPRQRAEDSTPVIPSDISSLIPAGYVGFYAQHDLVFANAIESSEVFYFGEDGLAVTKVELIGQEVQIVPTSEDI